MHIFAFIVMLICGLIGEFAFDAPLLGAVIGLVLSFVCIFIIAFIPSKRDAEKAKTRNQEDKKEIQEIWGDESWFSMNATSAYSNRQALRYRYEIVYNPGTHKGNRILTVTLWGCCALFLVVSIAIEMAFGLLLSAMCAVLAIIIRKSFPKKYVTWIKAVNYNFVNECKEAGISDLSSQQSVARMVLIARKIGMEESEAQLIQRFNRTIAEEKMVAKKLEKRSNEDRMDALRDQDKRELESVTRKLTYHGRDKMIHMCREKAEACKSSVEKHENELREINSKYERATMLFKEKEHDWATAGGAVSAIAGGAAGVVTAINLEAENVEIRKRNAKVSSAVAGMSINERMAVIDKLSAAEKEVAKWEKRAKAAEDKLVEELPENDLLALLSPTVKSKEYNKIGTLRIKVDVLGAKTKIYSDVPAVVDGSFRAVFKKSGETIGEAAFILPYNGASRKQTLTGICMDAPAEADIQTIEFMPVKLWAIES